MNLYLVSPRAQTLDAELLPRHQWFAGGLELDDQRFPTGDQEDVVRPAIDAPLDGGHPETAAGELDDSALDLRFRTRH